MYHDTKNHNTIYIYFLKTTTFMIHKVPVEKFQLNIFQPRKYSIYDL